MKREILFKAKRIDNGEWVEGSLLVYPDEDAFICVNDCIPDVLNKYEVYLNTICQYTGLTDENGKKIWENDIVEIPSEDGYFKCEWEEDTTRFVLNGDGLSVDFDNCWSYEVEVVGNIFDNPELVGGAE